MKILNTILKASVNFLKLLIVLAIVAYGFSFYPKLLKSNSKNKFIFFVLFEFIILFIYWMGWDNFSFVLEANKIFVFSVVPCLILSHVIKNKLLGSDVSEEDEDFEIGMYLSALAVLHFVLGILIYSFLATKGYDATYWGQDKDDLYLYIIAFPVFPAVFGITFNITAKDLLK
jgi:hypothetical protein